MHQSNSCLTTTLGRKIIELVSKGSFEETLTLYKHLHSSGTHGNPSFLPSILKACSSSHSLSFACQLHSTILKIGHLSDTVILNSLLFVYSKHLVVASARQLFDAAPIRDTVTWNSMITCYIENGYFVESIELFKEMQFSGYVSKPELLAAVLSVCGRIGSLRLGKAIHARAVRNGEFDACVLLSTTIVDMYSRCCDLDRALRVFNLMLERNEVSWTAMITGCTINGRFDVSLEVFRAMVGNGIEPNRVTIVTVLPACGELGALKHGKEIHGYILRHGFESESQVIGVLIDMYCKCKGATRLASLVFERAEERDIVTWSSMIGNSSRNGDSIRTMKLFQQMQIDDVKPNSVTMLAMVAACIGLSSLDHGRGVHGYILKSGLFLDVFVGNSLIDMYGKCGCLNSSIGVFVEMPVRDSASYSSMISSYGLHGLGYDALRLFNEMQELGTKPDEIAFLAVLSACNHSGLVDEGEKLFNHVNKNCEIALCIEHYACYVDLLGKSGRLQVACEVMQNMPMKPSARILSSLVLACRVHGRFEAAEQFAIWLIGSEPENAANYTLLCAIYAEGGNWTGMEEVRRVMRERGVKKGSGCSQIEIGNRVYC